MYYDDDLRRIYNRGYERGRVDGGYIVLNNVRAIVSRKYIKGVELNNTISGNEKKLVSIIECELIDDLPDNMIGKIVKIHEMV